MSRPTIPQLFKRISYNNAAMAARYATDGLTPASGEAMLAIANDSRLANDALGHLLQEAANGRPAPGARPATPRPAAEAHANNTSPLATIGGDA
jgi:hypothetical protein